MHYEIRRGFKGRITKAQRASGIFAEEPVVLGKVLRRNSPPRILAPEQFERSKTHLLRLLLAGSIEILVVDENKEPTRLDYRSTRFPKEPPAPVAKPEIETAGDDRPQQPPAPASTTAPNEEQGAATPPSSGAAEDEQDEEVG